jgi:hypothetical protein
LADDHVSDHGIASDDGMTHSGGIHRVESLERHLGSDAYPGGVEVVLRECRWNQQQERYGQQQLALHVAPERKDTVAVTILQIVKREQVFSYPVGSFSKFSLAFLPSLYSAFIILSSLFSLLFKYAPQPAICLHNSDYRNDDDPNRKYGESAPNESFFLVSNRRCR